MASTNSLPAVFNPQPRATTSSREFSAAAVSVHPRTISTISYRNSRQAGRHRRERRSIRKGLAKLNCSSAHDRVHLAIFICMFVLLFSAVLRLAFGVWAAVEGVRASSVADLNSLSNGGMLQIAAGLLFMLIGGVAIRMTLLTYQVGSLTSSAVKCSAMVLLYVVILDIGSCVMLGDVFGDGFSTSVNMGMEKRLRSQYGQATQVRVTSEWDQLQEDERCCGAGNHTDWFASNWSFVLHSSQCGARGSFPASCRMSAAGNESDETCVGGILIAESPSHVCLANLTDVQRCGTDPTLTYVYASACRTRYATQLSGVLRSAFACVAVVMITCFWLILMMFFLASLLPRRQAVTSAYST